MGYGGESAAGYDHNVNLFSAEGRIYQVEYAREAVAKGTPAVGLLFKDGVMLVAVKRLTNKLMVPDSINKIFDIDDHISLAVAGMVGDAGELVEAARTLAQNHELQYGEPIPVKAVVQQLSSAMVRSTRGGFRPFGVGIIVAGIDANGPHLYEIDPSGTFVGYKAAVIGKGRVKGFEELLSGYEDDMTEEDAGILAALVLQEMGETPTKETIETRAIRAL